MKFKVVNNKRINVYLTKEDVEREQIDIVDFYSDSVDIRQKLSHVFSLAENETGFRAIDSSLEIEVIPIIDGDLLISISKTNSQNKEKTYLEGQTQTYSFEEFESVVGVIHELQPFYQGASSLYQYKGEYYLILYPHGMDLVLLKNMMAIMGEYGENLGEDGPNYLHLQEHGLPILKRDAVESIYHYFLKNK